MAEPHHSCFLKCAQDQDAAGGQGLMATLSQAASGDNILTSVGGRNKLFLVPMLLGHIRTNPL